MNKLTSLIRRAPKRFSAIVAMVAAAVIVPAAVFAWGPNRDTFTIEQPSDHVQFNSITNNPNIGDERNFVGIREVGSANTWYDDMTVQDGKEYYVRMYVHNNAADNLNLVAENVTAKFNLPTTTGKSIQVNGFLSASNVGANGKGNAGQYAEVYDHATFNAAKDFNLAYVANSLKYENNAFGAAGTALPESIFTSAGAKLGYDKLDGKIPGCFKYAGYVTFKVKPQFAKTTNFTLTKKVSKSNADKTKNQWVEDYKAQPGETVDFMLAYKNTGEVNHDDVTFRDTLPKGLTYVAKSGVWNNASKQNVAFTNDAALTNGTGVNVGSYAPGANAWVVFSAKVAEAKDLECGTNSLVNKGKVNTGGYAVEDTATVIVDKECQPEKIQVCELATKKIIPIDENQFDASKHSKNLEDCKEKPPVKIEVCELDTKKIISIDEKDFDASKHSKNLEDCKEKPPVKVTVCELETKKIITIDEKDFDSSKHSKNLDDCKEVPPVKIEVCELDTKKIISIDEKDFDASKHSKNLEDCKETPPTKIEVCELTTKQIITIDEKDFDASKHSKDFSKCEETPVVPPELPQTGVGENIVAITGLGALIASAAYYIASRRALNQ